MPKSKPAKPIAKTKNSAPAKAAKVHAKSATAAKVGAKVRGDGKVTKANGDAKPALAAPSSNNRTGTLLASNRRAAEADAKLSPFLRRQKERLVQLRDSMVDSMLGVAKDTLRSRAEGSEASAFGMHQADAGSDAYDRDFALSLLSQEQDALYEIEEAIKRIEHGTYGVCEMSGKPIAHPRLEAIPFTRYTVECQSQIEKQNRNSRTRVPVTSLFGLTDEEPGETEEEEPATDAKE
jgi:RNA polymerase-binding transcription factor DksA